MIVRWLIFLTTMGAMQSFSAILAVYCFVKKDIGEQYELEANFIGAIDFFILIGQSIGTLIFAISVPFQPKRYFFFCCLLQIFAFCLVGFVEQQQQFSDIFACAAFLFFGFGRGSFMVPFFIFSQQFDVSKQSQKFTLWTALVTTGYLIGFLSFFIFQLNQIGWQRIVLVSSLYFLIWTVFMELSAEEVVVEKYVIKRLSPSQRGKILYGLFKQFLESKSNRLFLFDLCCMELMVQSLIFWLPYYLAHNGFPQKGSNILIVGSITILIGFPIVNTVRYFIKRIEYRWSVLFIILNMLCYLFLNIIDVNPENQMKVAALIGGSGFLFGSVLQQTTLFETTQKINYTNMDKALLYCLFKALRGVFSAVLMLIIGLIMNIRMQTYLQILVLVSALVVISHIKRVKYQTQNREQINKTRSLQLKSSPQKASSTDSFFHAHLNKRSIGSSTLTLRKPLRSKLTLQ